MADTSAASGLTVQQWDDRFFKEYFQENRFKPEMGTSENNVIHVKEFGSDKGKTMTWALVNRLTSAGVTGSSVLEGNEEAMDSREFTLDIDKRRNGVRVAEIEEQYSAIGLREAGRSVLMDWAMEDTRDRIIAAMQSIGGVAYGSATAAQRDAWLDANIDRVLFGEARSNVSTSAPAGGATNDHSASLAAVTSSTGKLDTDILGIMKRMALTASPAVRPMRSETSGRRYYVLYVHPYTFRDLKADTALIAAQRDVSLRMQNEKLFRGGDVEWDGIIVKEIDDIPILSGVGDSSIDLAPAFLCGAQAVAYGIKRRWSTVTETFDYGDKRGVAIQEIGNFGKFTFSDGSVTKDHGIVTGYFPAIADS